MKAESKTIILGRYLKMNTGYFPIELKPLSSISDEDCNWIADCNIVNFRDGLIGGWNGKYEHELYDAVRNDIEHFSEYSEVSQYLQLKGYATEQTVIEDGKVVTYSVEELVKEGVFKLI